MLNAATEHLNAAWELMKWLNLGAPNGDGTYQLLDEAPDPDQPDHAVVVTLWDYRKTTIQAVAPPLRGKTLNWWADAAIKGYARPQLFYVYDYVQAASLKIKSNWMTQIQQNKVTPVAMAAPPPAYPPRCYGAAKRRLPSALQSFPPAYRHALPGLTGDEWTLSCYQSLT